ncbi:MAG: tripartite tricarboxylate transporter substrate binding protein [Pelosinus sp.]|nr:tripartite tricarboxylate transporter substrate binding protein [Pelosinus sp.]
MQSQPINASKYPGRPITVLVPFSAGGLSDSIARAMEKVAVKHLGQPLLIVNKPGGAGTIAWNELAGSKPDGYTTGIAGIGTILQPLYGPTKYNYSTALEPIAKISNISLVMVVMSDSNWGNLEEFIAYAKAHPGEIKYGHSGLGSVTQVGAEMFAQAAGIKMQQVPFQGDSESIAALLGKHVQVIFSFQGVINEYVKSGKTKVLAVCGDHRIKNIDFKDVPTFKEQGLDVVTKNWQCLAIPKEMPSDVKNKLVSGIKAIINDAEFQTNLKELGISAEYLGPEDCLKEWAIDNEQMEKVVRDTGIADQIAAHKK